MKPASLPAHRVAIGKVPGAPYSTSTIYIQTEEGERLIHSQLGPYDAGEVEQRIRGYMAPAPALVDRPVIYHTKPVGRPRKDAQRPPVEHHNEED